MDSKESRDLLLDGGVLLNLLASGYADAILQASAFRCATLAEIASEQFTFVNSATDPSEEAAKGEAEGNLHLLRNLEVRRLDIWKYSDLVVPLSVILTDVYACLLATASHERATLATDDEYIRHLIDEEIGGLTYVGTLELVKNWQEQTSAPISEVRRVVTQIATLAEFEVPTTHYLKTWWEERVTSNPLMP